MRFLPLIAILVVATLLRLPAFFQPPWYMDEGIFAAIADAWVHGAALYAGAWDNKPPGIFAVYALGWSTGLDMLAVRLLDLAAMLGVVVLVFAIARRTTGQAGAVIAATVAGLLLGLPTIEGNIANTESFLVLFSTAGMYFALDAIDRRRPEALLLLAGLSLGMACMFKQVAAFDVMAAGLFLVLVYRGSARRPVLAFAAGVLIWPLAVSVLFLLSGNFHDLWFATVESLVGYREDSTDTGLERYLVALIPMVIALPFSLSLQPRRTHAPEALFVLWLAFTAIAVSASGRAYPHYLIQMVPPFALVAGMVFSVYRPRLPRAGVLGLIAACLALAHVILGPLPRMAWYEPGFTRAYYDNFVDYALGDKDREEHDAFFGARAHTHLGLYPQLEAAGLRSQQVFVWGDVPWLYTEAGLENPTRYMTLFNAEEVEGDIPAVAALLSDLEPRYILIMEESRSSWEQAQSAFSVQYSPVTELERAVLYERP